MMSDKKINKTFSGIKNIIAKARHRLIFWLAGKRTIIINADIEFSYDQLEGLVQAEDLYQGLIKNNSFNAGYGTILIRQKNNDITKDGIIKTSYKTIKDEFIDFVFQNSGIRSRNGGVELAKELTDELFDKYHITPKNS